ncbi:hypothetical protein SASPL_152330 [Salvia splendens]|uniref:TCP domain-containing protein n=1 Tax=Salvia splendens TaxID=180675 RepID=A0A8X8W335_SALSN|nr:hypothetical protein SASPL_152330 [Salvia splendens]
MYAPINPIQSQDDEADDDHQQPPPSFLNYYSYNHSFPSFDGAPSNPPSPPRKRKSEAADGGGGRVVRAGGRKDRHSKVRTARGPRDRRVRLSPATAIQFYDVQDRLGYDRPSKAIDWLINEAKAAIDALGCDQNLNETGGFSFSGDYDLQKMISWSSVSESFSSNSMQPNLFREPLQSSNVYGDFGGFHFASELSKIAASATNKQDENLKELI